MFPDCWRNNFPLIPIITLTATATEKVREDIIKQLHLEDSKVFISSFNRPNLSYEVLSKKDSLKSIIALLNNYKGESVIIYCFSRNDTEKLVDNLNNSNRQLVLIKHSQNTRPQPPISGKELRSFAILFNFWEYFIHDGF